MGQFWIKLWAGFSTLTNQDIEGDIIINSISSLTINLVGSSIKEKINEVNTAVKLAINLDSDSKIIFTVNSYYTSIVNEKTLISLMELNEAKSSSNKGNRNNNNNQGQGMPNRQPPGDIPNGQLPTGQSVNLKIIQI